MRTIQDMIRQEVLLSVSSIVSALAATWGVDHVNEEMDELHEKAQELVSPVADYEEAAIQAGWLHNPGEGGYWRKPAPDESDDEIGDEVILDSAQEACEHDELDPIDREVFEHWAVTDWFADKLIEAGEKVDKDFAGLCVWARTTTGQAIYADGVIERIYAATHQPEPVEG